MPNEAWKFAKLGIWTMKLGISPQKIFCDFAAGTPNLRFSSHFFLDSFSPNKKRRDCHSLVLFVFLLQTPMLLVHPLRRALKKRSGTLTNQLRRPLKMPFQGIAILSWSPLRFNLCLLPPPLSFTAPCHWPPPAVDDAFRQFSTPPLSMTHLPY